MAWTRWHHQSYHRMMPFIFFILSHLMLQSLDQSDYVLAYLPHIQIR
jgi:hypothetical protein